MATTKQVTYQLRVSGASDFSALATKDFSHVLDFNEVIEKIVDVEVADIDVEYDFTALTGGSALAIVVRVLTNPVIVKINSAGGEILTVPANGMVFISGTGVEKVYLSGQPAGDARVYIQAFGS